MSVFALIHVSSADVISIADNVVIGAMTLVNKDISCPGTYVNKRVLERFGCDAVVDLPGA